MNIALISPTIDLVEYVNTVISPDVFLTHYADVTTLAAQPHMQFAAVLLDISELDESGMQELHRYGATEMQGATFLLGLSTTELTPDEERVLYHAGVVDILRTTQPRDIVRLKMTRYAAFFEKQREWEKANQSNEEQRKWLTFHANHDALTGIYNHRYFQEEMAAQFAESAQSGETLGLLMFDIDFFKEVNDSYGHQIGDLVLKEFTQLVSDELRTEQIWARYGGEEFMLILPGATKDEIQELAQTIRRKTARFVFCAARSGLQVTVSIGATMSEKGMGKVSTLIDQADHALYQAKALGRNRMVWYESTSCGESSHPLELSDNLACVRDRLRATLEKTRASALASFEAMVHSQTKDHLTLQARNTLALQMVNLLCKRLNIPRGVSQSFRRAFKLHDLLRLFISDATIKKSGSLSEAEMDAIEDQPLMLKQLTDLFDFFADERIILRYHHEYFDGSGYPEGLDGQDIPMGARLFAIVDAYVAMIIPSYKRPCQNKNEVIREFSAMSGVQFDPFLVQMLIDIVSDASFSDLACASVPGEMQ